MTSETKEINPVWLFASLTPYIRLTFLIQRKVEVFSPPMDKKNNLIILPVFGDEGSYIIDT
jgi:hypothetical protein